METLDGLTLTNEWLKEVEILDGVRVTWIVTRSGHGSWRDSNKWV